MHNTIKTWLKMGAKELDEVYRTAPLDYVVPLGLTKGTAIFYKSKILAFIVRILFWKGKYFYIKDGKQKLINRITPFGLHSVIADVYKGLSRLDGKATIVIDYSQTSFFCEFVRDEIRQVEKGLYIGKVWEKGNEVGHFALEV